MRQPGVAPPAVVDPLTRTVPLEQTTLQLRKLKSGIVRIATLNARTIGCDARLAAVAIFAERLGIHIICVQETRLTPVKLSTDDVLCETLGNWLRVDTPASPDGNYGVTTLISPSLAKQFAEVRPLLKHRAHSVVFKEFTVHNIYLLHKGRQDRTHEAAVISSVDTSAGIHFFAGDFNSKPKSADLLNITHRLRSVSAASVCGNRTCWTWKRGHTEAQLDHILVPQRGVPCRGSSRRK